ncbi:MAG TPA: PEP/pyruvate-binding domain-containing protein [Bryobacteraceae bacterium]|nr:PEP/pyruvate-binding domain-containing protein [Bryobacteraceae bacterium]
MQQIVFPLSAPEATDSNRFGPKAANLARMGQAGLPIPDGFCVDAEAYRAQIRALRLEPDARGVFSAVESPQARRHALMMKLGLLDQPITPELLDPLLDAWRRLQTETGAPIVVRSSALVEDRFGSSFAGQFESFLGIENEADFITAIRSCWGALWATRALRYMATHDIDPADTAMGILVQPLVSARASGGGLSESAEGNMILSATWGLGSAIAQGEVTPDRYELSRDGALVSITPGRKDHQVGCIHTHAVPVAMVSEPCLTESQAIELGALLRRVEELMKLPVEIEWAMDDSGFQLLQARPLHMQPAATPDAVWLNRPRLNGHAAGVGWGEGRACVIQCECELSRVAPGDVLVTKVAGPALSHILTRVAGVVAERGGSTSHMASLARERGIPMVLGVLDATSRIPHGSTVAVDGVAGVVRWMN